MEKILVEPDELIRRIGHDINPWGGLLLTRRDGALKCLIARHEEGPHPRAAIASQVIEAMLDRLPASLQDQVAAWSDIVMQGEDNPLNIASLGWQAKSGWRIRLLPDVFYFEQRGYEDFATVITPWAEREAKVFWRGSSTGQPFLHHNQLPFLPRYKLCQAARSIGPICDAKMVAVVQAANAHEHDLIVEHLKSNGLFGSYERMEDMHRYKFIIDIDGNANAWNFLARMRLGCCILRVESEWHQWFANRFVAWKHFVPVRADLSDLAEKVDWCLSHDAEASIIAARGCALAKAIRFDNEMDLASQRFFAF